MEGVEMSHPSEKKRRIIELQREKERKYRNSRSNGILQEEVRSP